MGSKYFISVQGYFSRDEHDISVGGENVSIPYHGWKNEAEARGELEKLAKGILVELFGREKAEATLNALNAEYERSKRT